MYSTILSDTYASISNKLTNRNTSLYYVMQFNNNTTLKWSDRFLQVSLTVLEKKTESTFNPPVREEMQGCCFRVCLF